MSFVAKTTDTEKLLGTTNEGKVCSKLEKPACHGFAGHHLTDDHEAQGPLGSWLVPQGLQRAPSCSL